MAFTRLKKALGPFGFIADALSVGTANWGVIVSALVAFGALVWKGAIGFLTNPQVQLFGGVFLWSLWTYIALSILYRVNLGIKTIATVDYSHAIILEGVILGYDPESDDAAVQVGLNIRNVANGPTLIEVHDYRIIIDGRTIPDSPMVSVIVPRMGPTGIMSGTFKKEAVKDRAEGTVSLLLHYGPPDGPPVRKFKLKAKITIRLGEQVGVANLIESKEDLPI